MAARRPLVVLATIDPVLRDSLVLGLLMDSPSTVVVRHDILDTDGEGSIRRLVMDRDGVVEDALTPLEHACLSCAVREDAIPTLRRLAASGRWASFALALPVSAESLPVARALADATRRGGDLAGLRLTSVVGAVDLETCVEDLLGDDLLVERDLALTQDDRRAVGEALTAQIEHVDVLVTSADPARHPVASDLVTHLRPSDGTRVDGLHMLDVPALLRTAHDPRAGEARLDPVQGHSGHGPTEHGVWSMVLESDRPFHPERLVDEVARLGLPRVRSRGVFWVANRPDSLCAWDGAGGQLSIGEVEPWGRRTPRTRIVMTGTGAERDALRAAFRDVLLDDDEARRGLGVWLDRPDALEPWLGERQAR